MDTGRIEQEVIAENYPNFHELSRFRQREIRNIIMDTIYATLDSLRGHDETKRN